MLFNKLPTVVWLAHLWVRCRVLLVLTEPAVDLLLGHRGWLCPRLLWVLSSVPGISPLASLGTFFLQQP